MSADPAASPNLPRHNPWGAKRPSLWFWLLLAVCIGMTLWGQQENFIDHAIGNIIALVSVFAVLSALVIWFVFASEYPRRWRRIVFWSTVAFDVAAVVVFLLAVKVQHVSGELIPTLAFRWTKTPDQLLEKPQASAKTVEDSLFTPGKHDFPQFLGPTRSARIDALPLETDWHKHPPKLIWKQPIGAGWSSFAIVGGVAVTMEQRDQEEFVTCYSLADGKLLWSHAIQGRHEETLGGPGPRSTPTIDDGKVYALGATGVLRCLDLASGKELWKRDVTAQFGLTHDDEMSLVAWGRSASPLIVDNLVVVPAGGRQDGEHASLIAYDKETGQEVWRVGTWQIGYASPSLVELCGVRQILIVNEDTVSGHDPATGKVLWDFAWPGSSAANANTSQAIVLPGDRVFVSKGYSQGATLQQVRRDGDGKFTVEQIWLNRSVIKTKFTNAVVSGDFIYALSDGVLECIEWSSGNRKWKKGRYGHGQILLVGDVLLVLAESGEVALVAASPEQFTELTKFQAIEGKTWNNPALSGNLLLVRNAEEAACYELPLK